MIFWLDDRISETTKKKKRNEEKWFVIYERSRFPPKYSLAYVCVRSKSPTEIIRPGFAGNDGSRIGFLQNCENAIVGKKNTQREYYRHFPRINRRSDVRIILYINI